jgi:hypothetical protein
MQARSPAGYPAGMDIHFLFKSKIFIGILYRKRIQCTCSKSLRFESIARTSYSSYNTFLHHLFHYLVVDILSLNQRSRYYEKPK